MNVITLTHIGYVSSPRDDTSDDAWGEVEATIELCPSFDAEALNGIEEFSHVEVVFFFDRIPESRVERGVRHPRENKAWPQIGIFAQRGASRPNRLGVSIARLVGRHERQVIVRGLDAINGTPILDIKPVMREFLPREQVRQPSWSIELMSRYWH